MENVPNKKRNWFVRHKIITIISAVIILFIIIGAASQGANVNTTPTSANSSSSSSSSTKSAAKAHIGATVNVGGDKGLAVTAQQVIDPATSDSQYISADAGKRFVAVKLQIVNNGSSAYKDDANSNVTVIGSDNQSYTFDPYSVTECTNFSNGTYTLAAGESATGCVVFQIPDKVTVTKIQFQSLSGFSGDTGEWLVP